MILLSQLNKHIYISLHTFIHHYPTTTLHSTTPSTMNPLTTPHTHPKPSHTLIQHFRHLKSQWLACNYTSQMNQSTQKQVSWDLFATFDRIMRELGNRLFNLQNQNNTLIYKLSRYQDIAQPNSQTDSLDDELINLLIYNHPQHHSKSAQPPTNTHQINTKLQYIEEELLFQESNEEPIVLPQFTHTVQHNNKPTIDQHQQMRKFQQYTILPNHQASNPKKYTLSHFQNPPFQQKQGQSGLNTVKPSTSEVQGKGKHKEQFANVSTFVHRHLVYQLEQHQDHKRHLIPKKILLKKYLQWCQQKGIVNLLVEKPSLIQMAITNELKVAFQGIDCYTKSYRGLRFKYSDLRVSEESSSSKNQYNHVDGLAEAL